MAGPLKKAPTNASRVWMSPRTFNTIADRVIQPELPADGGSVFSPSTDTVLVQNNSGADIGRFGVLGIDGIVITPTANLADFKNQPCLDGGIPIASTHDHKFVITAEPIRTGAIGRAFLRGAVPVKLTVDNANHRYAQVSHNVATNMESSDAQGVPIIYKESGTGSGKWSVIDLGNYHWTDYSRWDHVTATGTWTVPSGVHNAIVILIGGGGGGGKGGNQTSQLITHPSDASNESITLNGRGGGGGGSGAMLVQWIEELIPGDVYDVTVGNGGAGSTSGSGSGTAGTATTFVHSVDSGLLNLSADGGDGGISGDGTPASIGGVGGSATSRAGTQLAVGYSGGRFETLDGNPGHTGSGSTFDAPGYGGKGAVLQPAWDISPGIRGSGGDGGAGQAGSAATNGSGGVRGLCRVIY